jgi:hypothetical protein
MRKYIVMNYRDASTLDLALTYGGERFLNNVKKGARSWLLAGGQSVAADCRTVCWSGGLTIFWIPKKA